MFNLKTSFQPTGPAVQVIDLQSNTARPVVCQHVAGATSNGLPVGSTTCAPAPWVSAGPNRWQPPALCGPDNTEPVTVDSAAVELYGFLAALFWTKILFHPTPAPYGLDQLSQWQKTEQQRSFVVLWLLCFGLRYSYAIILPGTLHFHQIFSLRTERSFNGCGTR